MSPTNVDEIIFLVTFLPRSIEAHEEQTPWIFMFQARRRRKPEVKKSKRRWQTSSLLLPRPPKKWSHECTTVYFPKVITFCQISEDIFNYYRKVYSTPMYELCGTTFGEASLKVNCSFGNAIYFFDLWFSPAASLEHKYSRNLLLVRLNWTLQKVTRKN